MQMQNNVYLEIQQEISKFNRKYKSVKKIHNNAEILIESFETNYNKWFGTVPFMDDCLNYEKALLCYCTAIDYKPSYDNVQKLASFISDFENYEYCNHMHLINLYYNLGITWHHLDMRYDDMAVKAFKKYIFYLLGCSSHTKYSPVCYAFRKCTTHLYSSLALDKLNLSSPRTFNDPFDCPIIGLLDTKDEIATLIRRAYLECVKVSCFVSNVKQPYQDQKTLSYIFEENKQKNNIEEYKNELMWAHYADYHKGICIKYHFDNSLSSVYCNPDTPVKFFRDIEYRNSLSTLSRKKSINIKDAFFTKSKAWKYENELRLLLCDLNSTGDYTSIDIPNSIEAIYFGIKCSSEDIKAIRSILKDKKYISKLEKFEEGKIKVIKTEHAIKFFQMEFDSKKFGSLIAKEL